MRPCGHANGQWPPALLWMLPSARRMLGLSMSIRQWFYVIVALALGTLAAWVTLGMPV